MNTKISYSEIARRVGDMVLANELMPKLYSDYNFELFNGKEDYCVEHDTTEDCEKFNYNDCQFENYEQYQNYIISQSGAEYLARNTNEIVYYCDELGLYIWGITHFGTGWDGVFTSIKS